MSAVTPQIEGISREERTPTSLPNLDRESAFTVKSQSLSAEEQEFVLKRKQVVLKSLNSLGIECTMESVPHIAVLGSGGGQRAAVGLLGSLYQMEKEGLLDTLLYLGGVSASAWSMSTLYSDPEWSSNMDRAVSRLSGPSVMLEQALTWLDKRAKDEHFSLTDIWGVLTSAGIMKQVCFKHADCLCLSVFGTAKWFEITPHEAGFTDLGLFINTSHLGSRIHEAEPDGKGPEMDMVKLQGIVGSAIADEGSLVNSIPDWLKDLVGVAAADENNLLDRMFLRTEVPHQVNSFLDFLDSYMRMNNGLLKLTELIKKNTEDPAVWSGVDNLQKTLRASSLIQKVFPLIWKWEWRTTENFLYNYSSAVVPPCVSHKEHLQLIDAGLMLNLPYPPFLGGKRDADLLIALDYGSDEAFKTLTNARDYAAAVKKPFPEIDNKILEERDWPKDCYVFEGKEKEPTIVYMPLFNRHNCKDAQKVKEKMEEFYTFQLPFSQDKIELVLETAKANVKNNKETLLREIYKAALRRHKRYYSTSSTKHGL
ncbi:cytosolic phospholipase A2 [Larimichthys crocea]|uniref:cytosolic phospholipase A2 n=1 Tax=Larimichthys crocea TaxID=215358 RepID=UPI000F5EB039|nr:cytosolic phospholipase A2 [Larimichthys crocea]